MPHLQGLDAAGDEVGNHAHKDPLLWVLRQESWSGPSLLQVLDDGQLSRGSSERSPEGARGPWASGDRACKLPLLLALLSSNPMKPRGSAGQTSSFWTLILQNLVPHMLESPFTSQSNQPPSLPWTKIYCVPTKC